MLLYYVAVVASKFQSCQSMLLYYVAVVLALVASYEVFRRYFQSVWTENVSTVYYIKADEKSY